ncbi:MAG: Acetolactate synthase [Rhodocyclaceae bacterium]|nr:Acetolactate synthase [Rhodocyclaceae bacterium]
MDELDLAFADESESPDSPPSPADAPQIADLIVSYLEDIGVEYVFGIPGGAIEPLYNALARSSRRGGPRPVVSRHEAGAAFMADGYARETGKLGVCIATSGPGATNLITGIACAHDSNIPVLAITGLPTLPSFGRNALQESSSISVNSVAMFRHCTRYNSLISHPDQLERKLINAIMSTRQAPGGAAHLSIPLDILRTPLKHAAPTYDLSRLLRQKVSLVDDQAVRELHEDIRRAHRIVFLIGAACGEAIEAIMELIERTGALFVTTPDAKGLINPRHPSYCGVFGFGGHSSADELLADTPDLLLAFGTGFAELISGNRCDELLGEHLVHIDSSEENLLRTPMARQHVRGRILSVCQRLLELLDANPGPIVRPGLDTRALSAQSRISYYRPEAMDSDAVPIKPQRLMKMLSEHCPPTTRFFADIGNSMVWTAHYLEPGSGRHQPSRQENSDILRQPSGAANWLRLIMEFCPMGWAIGSAIGAARGNPDSPVVCITGDGAYLMSGQEITVAAQEGLPVIFVVLNDAAYGMVKHGQRLAKAEQIGAELPHIDYRRLAEAMGISGHVIESPQDLEALDFATLFQRKGPTLLDVRVDPEEVPPMSLRMKALGTMT